MNKEEVTMLGFEIVAYAGDARSKMLEALSAAQSKEYDRAYALMDEAQECLNDAHKAQTLLLQQEAQSEDIPYSVTMMHGQDHLMTSILLHDLMKHLIVLYRRS